MTTVIVTTAFGSIDRVVEAMRLGAYDFLTKPIDPTYLKLVMDRALKKRELQDEVLIAAGSRLKENFSVPQRSSPRIKRMFTRSSS